MVEGRGGTGQKGWRQRLLCTLRASASTGVRGSSPSPRPLRTAAASPHWSRRRAQGSITARATSGPASGSHTAACRAARGEGAVGWLAGWPTAGPTAGRAGRQLGREAGRQRQAGVECPPAGACRPCVASAAALRPGAGRCRGAGWRREAAAGNQTAAGAVSSRRGEREPLFCRQWGRAGQSSVAAHARWLLALH